MRNIKALELLNNNRIEDLKKLLEDEIYEDSLKVRPGAKKRYMAMKKYFTYHTPTREVLQKPCTIQFEGKDYTCFTNSWSLAMTTEDTGEIDLFDNSNGRYPDVVRLLRFDGIKKKLDFHKVLAEAKSKGYKLNKTEVNREFKYLMLYDGTYYKMGLFHATFGIIDDGSEVMTYHPDGVRMPLTIKNDIGLAMIMPVKFEDGIDPAEEGHIVIEVPME